MSVIQRDLSKLNDPSKQNLYDIIILGGGCAGLTAGIYAGRAKLRTMIIEKIQVGGQAYTTDEIENYPGFKQITGPELMERIEEQVKAFDCELLIADVTKVNLIPTIKQVYTTKGMYQSKTVVLATGGVPRKLGFEGEETFRGKGIGYCATCDGFFFRGKDIFVIGGGDSAAKEALYLTRFGKRVIMLVRKGQFRCEKILADQVLSHPKIEVKFHTEIVKAYGGQTLQGAVFKNNQTGELIEYQVSKEDGKFGIFVFVGYEPATWLFRDQIEMDENGYVLANENTETNLPGVFAAGDLRSKTLRQLITAAADGAVAVTKAEEYITKYIS